MKAITHYPGAGIDLAYGPDGQLVVATVVGAKVRLERGPVVVETSSAPQALLARELRVAVASDGRIACIGQIINPDRAVVYVNGFWRVLADRLFGQLCVAIWAIGDRFRWATVTDGGGTLRIEEEGGPFSEHLIQATSQGILSIEDGEPVLADTRKDVDGLFHAHSVGDWTVGYGDNTVVVRGPNGYQHTVVNRNTSTPRLAVSGETVQVGYSLDGRATVVTLTPPYPTEQAVSIPAIGRPLWSGWFQFGTSPVPPPGNCRIVVTHGADKFITTLSGRKIAAYAEGSPDGDIAALDRAIAAAASHGLPVVPYWTRRCQEGRLPRGADTVGVEAYRQAGESLSVYESRVTASVRRCGKAWLIGPAYSSNALNHADLASVVPVLARIARMNQNVVGVLWFSAGLGRATGWEAHPEIHDEHRALFSGIPSTPPLPATPKPPTPKPPTPPAPVPPVERPAPMFPTDDELTDFTNRLEAKYRDELHRAPVATAVDPLGRGRWTYDYALHRQAGQSHNAAWDKVNFTINEIAGIPNP